MLISEWLTSLSNKNPTKEASLRNASVNCVKCNQSYFNHLFDKNMEVICPVIEEIKEILSYDYAQNQGEYHGN